MDGMELSYWEMLPLVWSRTFLGDFGGYLIAAGVGAFFVFGLKPRWLMARKIQKRTPMSADLKREIFHSAQTTALYGLVSIVGFTIHQAGFGGVYTDIEANGGWLWVAASVPLVLLAHDTWFYWTHRAMHHRKLFRLMHATHHKSRTPTPFTAYSFAPLEAISHASFAMLYTTLVPVHPGVMLFFIIFQISRNVMGHLGHEFHPRWWVDNRWTGWLNTPTHHDLHHSSGPYNFGLYFTWWDRMMGTEHPRYKEEFRANVAKTAPIEARRYLPGLKPIAAALVALVIGIGFARTALADPAPPPAPPVGFWQSTDEKLVVEIKRCTDDPQTFCGIIAWHADAVEADGTLSRDVNNDDPALRARPILGLQLGWGFEARGEGRYRNGHIYDPESGSVFASKINHVSAEALDIKGCVWIFCRTEHLHAFKGDPTALLSPAH